MLNFQEIFSLLHQLDRIILAIRAVTQTVEQGQMKGIQDCRKLFEKICQDILIMATTYLRYYCLHIKHCLRSYINLFNFHSNLSVKGDKIYIFPVKLLRISVEVEGNFMELEMAKTICMYTFDKKELKTRDTNNTTLPSTQKTFVQYIYFQLLFLGVQYMLLHIFLNKIFLR